MEKKPITEEELKGNKEIGDVIENYFTDQAYYEEKSEKETIEDIIYLISEELKECRYINNETIIDYVIKNYLIKDKQIIKYINEENRKTFSIPKYFENFIKANKQEIENNWQLMKLIYDKDIKDSIKNMELKEQETIIEEIIDNIYSSGKFNKEEYAEKGILRYFEIMINEKKTFDKVLENINDDLNDIENDETLSLEEKRKFTSERKNKQIIANSLKTNEGKKVLIDKIKEKIIEHISYYEISPEELSNYEKLIELTKSVIYEEDKDIIEKNVDENIEYLKNNNNWEKITKEIDCLDFYDLLIAKPKIKKRTKIK